MKKPLLSCLIVTLAGMTVLSPAGEAGDNNASSSGGSEPSAAWVNNPISVPHGNKVVSVSVTGENIRTVLHSLATQGGFNLVMDESVSGEVTVEMTRVTLNQALQSVAELGDLLIVRQSGDIFLAIGRQAAQDKGVSRQLSKIIKINYANANRIAGILNRSVLAASGGGGGQAAATTNAPQKARADARTNSIIVVGTAHEIELAEAAAARLDVPRQSKTFYLSHANALDVATMLSSSIFNDGTASIRLNGSGGGGSSSSSGASGSGGVSVTPSNMRIERQDIQEGSGINNFGGGSGSSGGGGVSSGLSGAVTLRGVVKATDNLAVSPEGVLIIPDTRQNAITIMGTAEQIAMAESLIPTLDAQLPQVAIEASLVEISDTGVRELGARLGVSDGRLQSGFNNLAVEGVGNSSGASGGGNGSGTIGLPTVDASDTNSYGRTGIMFSTNPLSRQTDYLFQLRNLMTTNKAKILANPTVVATHDSESIISIVDEIVRRVTTTVDSGGFATQTVEIGEAGIVMDILPKVGEDGTVTMRLRPSVTTVLSQTQDTQGNLITLLSKRDLLTQNVRIRDGQTLVIGGLIQQRDTVRTDKMPGAGDMPILGAMFRASQRSGKRSELVILITPHIIGKTRLAPVNTATTGNDNNSQPVSFTPQTTPEGGQTHAGF